MIPEIDNFDEDDDSSSQEDLEKVKKPKVRLSLKNKINFVSKMFKMQKILRTENEKILKIKALNNNKLPMGILQEGAEALNEFLAAKKEDSVNELRPKSVEEFIN